MLTKNTTLKSIELIKHWSKYNKLQCLNLALGLNHKRCCDPEVRWRFIRDLLGISIKRFNFDMFPDRISQCNSDQQLLKRISGLKKKKKKDGGFWGEQSQYLTPTTGGAVACKTAAFKISTYEALKLTLNPNVFEGAGTAKASLWNVNS